MYRFLFFRATIITDIGQYQKYRFLSFLTKQRIHLTGLTEVISYRRFCGSDTPSGVGIGRFIFFVIDHFDTLTNAFVYQNCGYCLGSFQGKIEIVLIRPNTFGVTDDNNIFWSRNYFCSLLLLHGISAAIETGTHSPLIVCALLVRLILGNIDCRLSRIVMYLTHSPTVALITILCL